MSVSPPLRKDAERSRTAILAAARELFACGPDVPMYEIGRRAGVGQATLYRHFPDRSAIVAALGREQVELIEAVAAGCADDDDALVVVLAAATDMVVSMHDLIGILRHDAALAPVLEELRTRMLAVFSAALERSRTAYGIRDDLSAGDLLVVMNMISGALVTVTEPAERVVAARRALALVLDGLRS